MTDYEALLAGATVIPVLTIDDAADAVPLARALVRGGLRVLEITLRTAAGAAAARRIRAEVPDAVVALGTVLNARDVRIAGELGLTFSFSPGATPDLLQAAREAGLALIPGVQTASELMLAAEFGFGAVKFFPAAPAGGPDVLRALAGPFPAARFCPTGGIAEENLPAWFALPSVFAVGGSWIARPADIAAGRWDVIEARARMAAVQAKR